MLYSVITDLVIFVVVCWTMGNCSDSTNQRLQKLPFI